MTSASIFFDAENKVFHLKNDQISYLFQADTGDILSHLYFGRQISTYHDQRRYPRIDRGFSPNPAGNPGQLDRGYSKDTLRQEFSGFDTGDFRQPAVVIRAENGAQATDFRYVDYEIQAGKPDLVDLPQAYVLAPEEAKTLIVRLADATLDAELFLSYTIFADRPVIARSAKLVNRGTQKLQVEKLVSVQLDVIENQLEVISLHGAHLNERQMERKSLPHGITSFASHRGGSSHHMNPFIALVAPDTTEDSGTAIGVQLVYSGNHQFTLEKDYVDQVRVLAGINEQGFSWQLLPDEAFQAPEALLVYSEAGLNGMSQAYHHLLRERVARGRFQYAPRPIVINNWEATYFNFDAEKIDHIVDQAAPLGIEMFVLDDGWFGHRDADTSSLGDWYEYADKLKSGGGLAGISQRVHDRGMQFGIWIEPEMVSKDSQLYRAHPDYAIQIPNRAMTPSRDQHVLDFSRQEVVDAIYDQISAILDDVPLDYIKWDMNRHLTEVYSAVLPADRQGEVAHRYVLGVYQLAERLTTAYPNILFEGCSGGGGRFDAGMLYYFPQSWASDNTDPVDRLKIQYGTSLSYPISSMTAHVSASPNHQTGRESSLTMRGDVAMAGVFGYELDLSQLSDTDKTQISEQVAFYKTHRDLIQYGDFYRIQSPFESNDVAWQFVSADKTETLLFQYRVLSEGQPPLHVTKLSHLAPDKTYFEPATGQVFGGDELMAVGFYNTPWPQADFTSRVRYFKQV
ncbi:alpha-galactosidase [Leuconostoc lactis]|uniref:alpha-galactosidase n=1 Tax=Leuconostoc lactis TaxID=1246 RepID=UPI000E80B3CC|nr:alpha-galactosidase [Leuconostoc lactis]QEA46879.1 alpha-galactosidase [Leuconostoc lactis]WKY78869.1 alpha-galactosidase [Leuconostoc lactis]HBP97574.1 alpha-galactosidase [Leuconostoc lactis]